MRNDLQSNSVHRKAFRDTQEATFRRVQRENVRKSNLTRTEKEVVLAFLNHWFVHRQKGAVHPGRKKIAKKANASMRIVNYTLSMLREFQVIEAVAFERGNNGEGFGKATEYILDTSKLVGLCQLPRKALVTWRKANQGRNIGVQKCAASGGAKLAPRNNNCTVIPFPHPRGN